MKGKTPHAPFRWTITQAVIELRVTANKVKTGVRRLGISPGKDGRFSSKDIFDALNNLTPLERKAREAVLQSKIDEAEYKRLLCKEAEDRLVDVDVVAFHLRDLMVTFVSTMRHCSLSDDEKRFVIERVRSVVLRTPSSGSKEYQQEKRNTQLRRQQEERECPEAEQQEVEQSTDGQYATTVA
jgi:hypothetical protein